MMSSQLDIVEGVMIRDLRVMMKGLLEECGAEMRGVEHVSHSCKKEGTNIRCDLSGYATKEDGSKEEKRCSYACRMSINDVSKYKEMVYQTVQRVFMNPQHPQVSAQGVADVITEELCGILPIG